MTDIWVDVQGFGDPAPRYLLATDGREAAIEKAKAEYVYDRIDLDELEERVEAALRGKIIKPAAALKAMVVLPKGMEIMHLPPPDPTHREKR